MKTIPQKRFDIGAKLIIEATVPITAADFQDALEQSKTLRVEDFVTVLGEHVDSGMQIVSISKDHKWPDDDEVSR